MTNLSLEWRALFFAISAHGSIDQRRRYTNELYSVHPIAVVEIVRGVPHTPEMIAAALLHDVVEDTPATLAEITAEFGPEVADLVDWLMDREVGGNRRQRKANSTARWIDAPVAAKTIKVADVIHNAKSIFACDPHFAVVFAREVEALLNNLQDADPALLKIAKMQLEEYTGIIHNADKLWR